MRTATILQTLTFCMATQLTAATERVQSLVQSIEVPAGERLILRAEATGYQIYRCDGTKLQWRFVAPEAKLSVHGGNVASHAAGPVWHHQDGSSVWGEVLAKAPSPNPDSIPQLLLKAVRTDGSGILSTANYIQRLQTQGGNAPTSGCDSGHASAEARVPYTAVYTFYAPLK